MLKTEKGKIIMDGAWAQYDEAIALLEQGDLREAAGKAWCAVRRAASALVLERTGRETTETWEISTSLSWLTLEDASFCSLDHGYDTAWAFLYGDCYLDNHCEPEDYHAELIRETADFIRDAERLA